MRSNFSGMLIIGFLSLFAMSIIGCTPIHQSSATSINPTITGKVSFKDDPVGDIVVSAIPSTESSFVEAIATSASTRDGRYELSLPEGEYYLFAQSGDLFSYFGRNPIVVTSSGISSLNMSLVSRSEGAETVTGVDVKSIEPFIENGLRGQVVHQGLPVAGAIIFVYTDLTTQLKGMGYAIAGPTDGDGYFEISLSAGTYYLIARSRHSEATVGPLQAGDLYGYYPKNPVQTAEQGITTVTIPLLEVPKKMEESAAILEPTIIKGTIIDPEGNGIEGVRAVLYQDPQMFNRPMKVSSPSDSNGNFLLRAPAGGRYYLAARDTLGGATGPGDLYGTYNETTDHSIQVQDGETLGNISIVVEEMW